MSAQELPCNPTSGSGQKQQRSGVASDWIEAKDVAEGTHSHPVSRPQQQIHGTRTAGFFATLLTRDGLAFASN